MAEAKNAEPKEAVVEATDDGGGRAVTRHRRPYWSKLRESKQVDQMYEDALQRYESLPRSANNRAFLRTKLRRLRIEQQMIALRDDRQRRNIGRDET